jgi:hypothetical protein
MIHFNTIALFNGTLRMKKAKKRALISLGVVFLLFWLGLVGYIQGINFQTSQDGIVSGVVWDIEKTGYVFKTWEGKITPGYGEAHDGGSMSRTSFYAFSISDEEVAKEVVKAARSGKRVNLRYSTYALRGCRYGSTAHNIEAVEYVQ